MGKETSKQDSVVTRPAEGAVSARATTKTEVRVGPGRSGPGTEQDTEAATDSFDRQVTVATLHS